MPCSARTTAWSVRRRSRRRRCCCGDGGSDRHLPAKRGRHMTITNSQSGTNVHEIADGIFRINTPMTLPGDAGAFSFNQYLIVDDEPLLFHTGLRQLFPMVHEAVAHVMPVAKLRHVAFSHVEADEC